MVAQLLDASVLDGARFASGSFDLNKHRPSILEAEEVWDTSRARTGPFPTQPAISLDCVLEGLFDCLFFHDLLLVCLLAV